MNRKIVLYSQPTCMDCRAAKQYFQQRGIDYVERDVTADPAAMSELQNVIGRFATPTIVIGDEVLLGFAASRGRIEALLGEQGEDEVPSRAAEHDPVMARILRESQTIAVVGLSPQVDRASHMVARYLQENGYRIIPVNPMADVVLGEKSYPDLAAVPESIDVVDVFRRAEYVPEIVEAAIAKGAGAVWLQEGIYHEEALARAREAGLLTVAGRCMQVEHMRLVQEGAL